MRRFSLAAFAVFTCADPSASRTMAIAASGMSKVAEATVPRNNCDFPKLDFRAAPELTAKERATFTENLRAAFDRACREGLFEERPLVDPRSYDRSLLYVINAPAANVTSIYFGPSAAPPAMLLESPFGSPAQIPSIAELHEAIYCEVRGPRPEEREREGRCLPD